MEIRLHEFQKVSFSLIKRRYRYHRDNFVDIRLARVYSSDGSSGWEEGGFFII